jgi:CHAT domain-containing protein
LIRSFAVRYVPNLATIAMTYERRAEGPVMVVGTSHYDQGFPDLPQAEEEAEIVRDWYVGMGGEVVPLIGPSAVEAGLKELEAGGRLGECRTLHFATHGFNVSSDSPMESRIALRDGFVDGIEISNWRLSAEVVVLSACCSGQRAISGRGMAELPGDELFGLQASFFMAGARRVLGALWPVDSKAAKMITTGFHRHLHAGLEPDVALQRATNDFLDGAGTLHRRTYYWGPFFMAAIGQVAPNGG